MARVLVAEDEAGVRAFLADALAAAGHEVEEAEDGEAAYARVVAEAFDLLVTDLSMPRMDGMELLRRARRERPGMAVVVLTAHGTIASAVEAVKLGAFDFLEKPLESPGALRMIAARAVEGAEARRGGGAESGSLARGGGGDGRGGVGESGSLARAGGGEVARLSWGAPAMEGVLALLGKVAPTTASVLLLGESGTGKEVAARWIHAHGRRASGPFVAVNCAALSETLLESDLFGHERGAFTGAATRKQGKIEAAAGGTFFLDEVGELRPELQTKLLRVLQERCFERVGGTTPIVADVRWVAATNRDLMASMREGRFREDLYHRLAVFPVHLPPLRARREDIPHLAAALLSRAAREMGKATPTLDEGAVAKLVAAPWPGKCPGAVEHAIAGGDPGGRGGDHGGGSGDGGGGGSGGGGEGGSRGARGRRADDGRGRAGGDPEGAGEGRREPEEGGGAPRDRAPDAVREAEAVRDTVSAIWRGRLRRLPSEALGDARVRGGGGGRGGQ